MRLYAFKQLVQFTVGGSQRSRGFGRLLIWDGRSGYRRRIPGPATRNYALAGGAGHALAADGGADGFGRPCRQAVALVGRPPRPVPANVEVQAVVVDPDPLEPGGAGATDQISPLLLRKPGNVHVEGVAGQVLRPLGPADLGIACRVSVSADHVQLAVVGLQGIQCGLCPGRYAFPAVIAHAGCSSDAGRSDRAHVGPDEVLPGLIPQRLHFLLGAGFQHPVGGLHRFRQKSEAAPTRGRRALTEVRDRGRIRAATNFSHQRGPLRSSYRFISPGPALISPPSSDDVPRDPAAFACIR